MADAQFEAIMASQIKTVAAQTTAVATNTTSLTNVTTALTALTRALTINSAVTLRVAAKLGSVGQPQLGPVVKPTFSDLWDLTKRMMASGASFLSKAMFATGMAASFAKFGLQALGSGLKIVGLAAAKVAAGLYVASKAVQLLNPGIVDVFNTALRDLGATLGVAFGPMLTVVTQIINQIAGALLPVMQALAPVLEQVARTIGAILVPIIQVFSSVLTALMPILKILADIFEIIGTALKIVIDIISAVLTPILEAIGAILSALEPILEIVALAFKALAALVTTVISAFKAFLRFISFGILGKEPAKKGMTAVPNEAPAIEAIAGLGNKIAQLAATANPTGAREGKAEGYLRQIRDGIEQLTRGKGVGEGVGKALTKLNPFSAPSFSNGVGNPSTPRAVLDVIGGLAVGGIVGLAVNANKE